MEDKTRNKADGGQEGPEHYDQPWREERGEPEPKAIEGLHDGRRVPEDMQRKTMDDTGVGSASRPDGDTVGNEGHESEGGLAAGSTFGTGYGIQGTTDRGPAGPGAAHATGQGRSAEGAFGEERAGSNASALNDFRDEAISKREIGPSTSDDRTQGGTQ